MRTLEQTRTISNRDSDLLREIKTMVQRRLPGATILLYGSVARGEQEIGSDYDLLILTDGAVSEDQEDALRNALYPWELERGVVVSKMFYTRDDWNRHASMPFH